MKVKIVHNDGYIGDIIGRVVEATYVPEKKQYFILGAELIRTDPDKNNLLWYEKTQYTFSESAIEPLSEFSYISSHRIGDRVAGLGEVEELRITDKGVYAVMVRMSPTGAKRRKIYKLEEL